jgi:beta-phosphoglucomutase-like phosphatase (HAD superfamily)
MVAVLASARLRGLFDAEVDVVEADRLGLAGKPDPALFLEAVRRLQVAPVQAAAVEDTQAGVEAGHRGRFRMVVGGPGRPGRRPGPAWRRPGRGRPGQLTLAPAVTPRGGR